MIKETAATWWLTGLSGAGKSTLAQALASALRARGEPTCVIDGHELRSGLCNDLGFDEASRAENVWRAAPMLRIDTSLMDASRAVARMLEGMRAAPSEHCL